MLEWGEKMKRFVFIMTIVLVTVLILAACGGGSRLVGMWENNSGDLILELTRGGRLFVYELQPDGYFLESVETRTWEVSGGRLFITYTLSDRTRIFDLDSTRNFELVIIDGSHSDRFTRVD